ncbi:hypothetical protein [Paludibacterium yongneupense]|uniref:hypothetical protein n=1 Tax=Paludibacterium yongneupense TaxID=400061 RepID=UPI000415053D|nr:hypothetical protein [Paludibacterium yongneupense]
MKQPRFDIDLDKHYNATMVIACAVCGHEHRMTLKTLKPDTSMTCQCGAPITLTPHSIMAAQKRAAEIRQAYRV